jgi:hypothetical protein
MVLIIGVLKIKIKYVFPGVAVKYDVLSSIYYLPYDMVGQNVLFLEHRTAKNQVI